MKRIKTVIKNAIDMLQDSSIRPLLEAEILLAHTLGQDRVYLHIQENSFIDDELEEFFLKLIHRRIQGEPIEYITQKVSFYAHHFFIDKGALIPRPESEILVQKVFEYACSKPSCKIAEVGVGSGALICSLALLSEKFILYGSDISAPALKIAQVNIDLYGLRHRISLFHAPFIDAIPKPIDILYSNPPYIQNGTLLPKSLSFEPQNALFGGKDGDEILKQLILIAREHEIPHLICEMGYNQRQSIDAFISDSIQNYSLKFYKDLAGLDRGFELHFY